MANAFEILQLGIHFMFMTAFNQSNFHCISNQSIIWNQNDPLHYHFECSSLLTVFISPTANDTIEKLPVKSGLILYRNYLQATKSNTYRIKIAKRVLSENHINQKEKNCIHLVGSVNFTICSTRIKNRGADEYGLISQISRWPYSQLNFALKSWKTEEKCTH